MTITLLPGSSIQSMVGLLDRQLNELSVVRSGDKYDVFNKYLRWATQASSELRPMMGADDVGSLVLSQRHWVLCGIDPASNDALMNLVQAEVAEREAALAACRDELRMIGDQWTSFPGDILVPDTNVLVHHTKSLDEVDWLGIAAGPRVRVIIPILVVDELDKRKRDRGETRTRARQTLRLLKQSFENPHSAASIAGAAMETMSLHLWLEPSGHQRLRDPDLELIDRCVALQIEANRDVTLVTFDTGMALRATAAGLSVHHLGAQDDPSQK